MTTTIQLSENVRSALESMKTKNETYEEVIVNMMKLIEKKKREQKDILIEGCKEMARDSLKITREFEHTDAEIDWEWNEN